MHYIVAESLGTVTGIDLTIIHSNENDNSNGSSRSSSSNNKMIFGEPFIENNKHEWFSIMFFLIGGTFLLFAINTTFFINNSNKRGNSNGGRK